MSVADNLARIRETIGNQPVRLIAVSKNAGLASIAEAFDLGVTEFGENRVKDALEKFKVLPRSVSENASWHFIGHLQTNKVKQVVGRFALIHSVDSLRLAQAVSQEAERQGIRQPVLLQVKVVEDESKFGFTPGELKRDFRDLARLPALSLAGLMTMAPQTEDREVWRRCFLGLRDLRDDLEREYGATLPELSMGMTNDWQEAVRCGSTMVRLGRAVFGN